MLAFSLLCPWYLEKYLTSRDAESTLVQKMSAIVTALKILQHTKYYRCVSVDYSLSPYGTEGLIIFLNSIAQESCKEKKSSSSFQCEPIRNLPVTCI